MDQPKLHREILEVGDQVNCDWCNHDYTASDLSGGFLFGNYAVCPECAVVKMESIKALNEENHIGERCPHDLSFADWVRKLRYRTAQTKVIITTRE
jgi:hypothetical protein